MKPILLALLMFVLAAHEAHAEVPARVTFSARLVNGTTVFNGPVQVDLRLFRDPSGGTSVWTESHATNAEAGLVSLVMGGQSPLDATVIDGSALYLEVTVDGTALSPRLAIGSAPYALLAGRAETAATAAKLGNLTASDVQQRTATTNNMTCPPGQFMRTISETGEATCVPAMTCARVIPPGPSPTSQTTSCPTGRIVVGGGCVTSGTAGVLDNYPATPTSWRCSTTPGNTVQAWPICCEVGS